ncbi:hypothetical protein P7K49_018065, partial [Saguinus oedipus]
AMGRGSGFLIGLLGAVWLLGSGHGEQQPPETAAQRCFCQVSYVYFDAAGPDALRGTLSARGASLRLFLPRIRLRCCCLVAGTESSARLAWRGPGPRGSLDFGAPSGAWDQERGVGARG